MGSDENHFNVSLTVTDKITRRCKRPQKPYDRLVKDGEKGEEGGMAVGGEGDWPIATLSPSECLLH